MRDLTLPTDPPPDAPLVSETYLADLEAVAEDRADETGPQPTVEEIEAVLGSLADPETTVPDETEQGERRVHCLQCSAPIVDHGSGGWTHTNGLIDCHPDAVVSTEAKPAANTEGTDEQGDES
jgi:hypothetical protein